VKICETTTVGWQNQLYQSRTEVAL